MRNQQARITVYDIIGCDEALDYMKPPPGPLGADELAWIDQQLRRTGRRAT